MELLKKRRTIRKFTQTHINTEQILDLIDCARLAPSAANLQPLKYVFANEAPLCDKIFPLTKWAAYLKGEGTPKCGETPTAYIAVIDDSSIKSPCLQLDAGAAAMSIITAAENMGIASCWICSFDKEKFSELFELADNLSPILLIALGYPSETSHAVDFCGDVKYYREGDGSLSVPKRSLDEVVINNQ